MNLRKDHYKNNLKRRRNLKRRGVAAYSIQPPGPGGVYNLASGSSRGGMRPRDEGLPPPYCQTAISKPNPLRTHPRCFPGPRPGEGPRANTAGQPTGGPPPSEGQRAAEDQTEKLKKTFNNGSLGSRIDEERSEMR